MRTAETWLRTVLSDSVSRRSDLGGGQAGREQFEHVALPCGQLRKDDVQQRGRTIGSCTEIATASETRLVVLCTTTLTLPDGSLTTQGVGDENPSEGPVGRPLGRHRRNRALRPVPTAGEAVGTFRSDSDVIGREIHLD